MLAARRKQRGHVPLAALVILAVVIVVAATGFVVYRHTHKSTIKSDTSTSTSQTQQQDLSNSTQPAQTAPRQ